MRRHERKRKHHPPSRRLLDTPHRRPSQTRKRQKNPRRNAPLTEAVIFDLDGTLINLPINYDRLFQEIGKIAKTNEIHPITKTIAGLDEKTRKKIFEKWEKIELDAFENMTTINEGMNLYKKYHDTQKV